MSAELLIYCMKGSPFVRKVQVLLAEKGIAYDFKDRLCRRRASLLSSRRL